MTNEEAIYVLKNAAWLGSDKDREATEEALDIAIEALTQDSRKVTKESTQDLISRQDAIDAWWHDEVFFGNQRDDMTKEQWLDYITDIIGSLPSADRPTGEVDAVAIYEKAEHDLEHGRITLGEFEKRIEPLKHLRYDRPTGEWVKDELGSVICSECKGYRRDNRVSHTNFCNRCGAKMERSEA